PCPAARGARRAATTTAPRGAARRRAPRTAATGRGRGAPMGGRGGRAGGGARAAPTTTAPRGAARRRAPRTAATGRGRGAPMRWREGRSAWHGDCGFEAIAGKSRSGVQDASPPSGEMETLTSASFLPDDGCAGTLVARVWSAGDVPGPSVAAIRADGVHDLSEHFPTMSTLLEAPHPAEAA